MPRTHTLRKTSIAALSASDLEMVMVECVAADGSHYTPERNWERTGWKNTAQDIASGRIERVHAVYQFGRTLPVTEDMAREVLGIVLDEYTEIPGPQRDWLESVLGVRAIADALRQRAA